MRNKSILFVSFAVFLLFSITFTLKVESDKKVHNNQDKEKKPTTSVENPNLNTSCSKQVCMEKYGMVSDPFNPHCQENATCWQEWHGFPSCKDDDLKCWKESVGYPKNCKDNDYECWIKEYGFVTCQDSQCLKDYLDYSCKYDDLECWKTKTWMPSCKWNHWDCWVKNSFLEWVCDNKKGYDCVSQVYKNQCKQDDQVCWRKALSLPDKNCENDVECFKNFYYLPTCKDDDFQCWKKLYYGPDCKKGDMECLKKQLFIPQCGKQKDEVLCYKKWLNYPDCKSEDGKCWKDWSDAQNTISGSMYWRVTYDHKASTHHHQVMSFGKMMDHRRRSMAQSHKVNREFHMKRAGLMN